jgi:endonuclease YncB( thermonuclease family)
MREAKDNRKGLWAAKETPVAPWTWRQKKKAHRI